MISPVSFLITGLFYYFEQKIRHSLASIGGKVDLIGHQILFVLFQKPFVIGFMVQSITKKEGQADQRNRSNLPYVAYLQMNCRFLRPPYIGDHKLCASVFRSAAISGFCRMRINAS